MKTWVWLKMVLSGCCGAAIVLAGVIYYFAHERQQATKTNKSVPKVTIQVGPAQPVYTVNPNGQTVQQQREVYAAVKRMLQSSGSLSLDASGFVQAALSSAGVSLPRTIADQAQTGTIIQDKQDLQTGDLVFFDLSGNGNAPTFDGVYMGQGQFAALTTHGLRLIALSDEYWAGKYLYGRRVLG
ncbi:MAG: C40 family peptidase [Alicyclobacillus herbarius]|uniref:C40 family peptidase n=1 Tax=Alicyclobacillus herbarius TaxID=122960 RepID=UPI0004068862|nr:NlpC/P60 family protein [Alicyclobacillus herbarius]MCL6631506.1 C40 family peptidase [Alicyclobacillus herbarius]